MVDYEAPMKSRYFTIKRGSFMVAMWIYHPMLQWKSPPLLQKADSAAMQLHHCVRRCRCGKSQDLPLDLETLKFMKVQSMLSSKRADHFRHLPVCSGMIWMLPKKWRAPSGGHGCLGTDGFSGLTRGFSWALSSWLIEPPFANSLLSDFRRHFRRVVSPVSVLLQVLSVGLPEILQPRYSPCKKN